MNFERHKEVLDTMKIGITANAPEVSSIWANCEGGSVGIKQETIPEFLNRLSENIFPDQNFAIYHVSLLVGPHPDPDNLWRSVLLTDLRGSYVKYKDKFYKIPNEI
jgi:hypothetical protein